MEILVTLRSSTKKFGQGRFFATYWFIVVFGFGMKRRDSRHKSYWRIKVVEEFLRSFNEAKLVTKDDSAARVNRV